MLRSIDQDRQIKKPRYDTTLALIENSSTLVGYDSINLSGPFILNMLELIHLSYPQLGHGENVKLHPNFSLSITMSVPSEHGH